MSDTQSSDDEQKVTSASEESKFTETALQRQRSLLRGDLPVHVPGQPQQPQLQSLNQEAAALQGLVASQQQGLAQAFNPMQVAALNLNARGNLNNPTASAAAMAQALAVQQQLEQRHQPQGSLFNLAAMGLPTLAGQTGTSPEQQLRSLLAASGRIPAPPSLAQQPGSAASAANPSDLLRLGNVEREAALLAARLRQAQNPAAGLAAAGGLAASLSGLSGAGAASAGGAPNLHSLLSSAPAPNPSSGAAAAAAGFPAALQAGLSSLSGSSNPLGSPIPSTAASSSSPSSTAGAFSSTNVTAAANLEAQIRRAQLMALQQQQQQAASATQQQHQQQLDNTRRLMTMVGAASSAGVGAGVGGMGGERHLAASVANWQRPQQQLDPHQSREEPEGDLVAALAAPGDGSGGSSARRGRKSPSTSAAAQQQPPRKRSKTSTPSSDPSPAAAPPQETTLAVAGALPAALPPVEAGAPTPHYSQREHVSLSTDEDQNWLSEFQCFIRQEILEVFRATEEDVRVRNNSKHLATQQVGIRCRFCAHLPPSARASRSSAFPSSVPQIYQSFTMMLRDHWPACESIPSPQKEQFKEFKSKNNQGASDSKNYWMHAARRIGMVNTTQGIQIDDASRAAAARIPPFGHNSDTVTSLSQEREDADLPMVLPEDRELLRDHPLGEYWYFLLSHVQRVRLSSAERVGNRKSLRLGLPGFGCRYCAKAGRLGLSRIFPARRRTLPSKIPDLHDHLGRCTLCPPEVKEQLRQFERQQGGEQSGEGGGQQQPQEGEEGKSSAEGSAAAAAVPGVAGLSGSVAAAAAAPSSSSSSATPQFAAGKEREFFTRIWARLGHGDRPEPA